MIEEVIEMNTHTKYLDAQVIQEDGSCPIVRINAEIYLFDINGVKSLNTYNIQRALERVLEEEGVSLLVARG